MNVSQTQTPLSLWPTRSGCSRVAWLPTALGLVIMLGSVSLAVAQFENPDSSRQVTLCGILATPQDNCLDPKLQPIGPQLQRLFPTHGFKLLGVNTQRVGMGQSLPVQLGSNYTAQAQLVNPLDINGKAQLRLQLDHDAVLEFATLVNTPLNQLFFVDKRFPDGSRLVLGIGVRP